MRELSIFCDESGDFGRLSQHAPYYLVSLVFHKRDIAISELVDRFYLEIRQRGLTSYLPLHTAPLIRREERYRLAPGPDRKRAFDVLLTFARRSPIEYKPFVIDKRFHGVGQDLERRLAQDLGQFIRENLSYFQSFDRVVVYYDRGQKEISRTLELIFSSTLSHVEFRTVAPEDYILFQIADLACTIELVEAKRESSGLTRSEIAFFGSPAKFRRNYLKTLRRKLFGADANGR